MDREGRYDHIEDVLVQLHSGQWFGWSPSKNKVYANLILTEKMGVGGEIIDNPYSLPTEKSLTDAVAKQQSDFDAQEYVRERRSAYPNEGDQFDMIYKDMKNNTTTHADAVEVIKTKWPKDNSGPVE